MNHRLQQLLDVEQLSPARFADMMGIQRSGVSHLLSGRNKPGFDFFEKILSVFPNLNLEWLISGRGKMFKDSLPSPAPATELPPAERPLSSSVPGSESPNYPESARPSILKILIFYSDNSFSEYYPQKM